MDIEIINQDILLAKEPFIAHQCKCTGVTGKGVAEAIFNKWPEANDYQRSTHGAFGSIKIHKVEDHKWIINMFSQYNSGKGFSNVSRDQPKVRETKFIQCLGDVIKKVPEIFKGDIAIPYLIGCNLGGGDWNNYLRYLENANSDLVHNHGIRLVLYKYP